MPETIQPPEKVIRQRRDELGLSRSKFARLVGKESNTVFAWEHGNAKPDFDGVTGLVQGAGIDPRVLFGTPAAVDTDKAGRES